MVIYIGIWRKYSDKWHLYSMNELSQPAKLQKRQCGGVYFWLYGIAYSMPIQQNSQKSFVEHKSHLVEYCSKWATIWKHPTGNFAKYLLGVAPEKSYLVKFWESSPGKFDLFLWYFFLLENFMCSNETLNNISWKIVCVVMIVFPPGKLYVF